MAVVCSGEPWGRLPGGSWATAAECAYPPALCVALAQAFVDQLLCLGATAEGRSLDTASPALAQAAAAAAARQPRGKSLKPLVSEHARVVRLRGAPQDLLVPDKLAEPVPVPQKVQSSPDLTTLPNGSTLPAGSKVLRRQQCSPAPAPSPGDCAVQFQGPSLEIVVGMPWEPCDFVRQAEKAPHPKFLGSAVPPVLAEFVNELGDSLQWSGALETYTSMARDRTAALRK